MDNSNILGRFPLYDNDVLGGAIRVFIRTGRIHKEILETAVGIGGEILISGDIDEMKEVIQTFRVLLNNMMRPDYPQPADEGQLTAMLCSNSYPRDVREKIARDALGYRSLDKMIEETRVRIRGIEEIF